MCHRQQQGANPALGPEGAKRGIFVSDPCPKRVCRALMRPLGRTGVHGDAYGRRVIHRATGERAVRDFARSHGGIGHCETATTSDGVSRQHE
jgi:hypothetical protein